MNVLENQKLILAVLTAMSKKLVIEHSDDEATCNKIIQIFNSFCHVENNSIATDCMGVIIKLHLGLYQILKDRGVETLPIEEVTRITLDTIRETDVFSKIVKVFDVYFDLVSEEQLVITMLKFKAAREVLEASETNTLQ